MTQKEKLIQALKKIKSNVTAKDRKEAVKEFETTYETVCRYLNGSVNDVDTATTLLEFFRTRIYNREQIIKQ